MLRLLVQFPELRRRSRLVWGRIGGLSLSGSLAFLQLQLPLELLEQLSHALHVAVSRRLHHLLAINAVLQFEVPVLHAA